MNHRQHYIELNPETPKAPPAWMIWGGACFALLTLWVLTVFLFSL